MATYTYKQKQTPNFHEVFNVICNRLECRPKGTGNGTRGAPFNIFAQSSSPAPSSWFQRRASVDQLGP